jgi:hypothetical protein
MRRDWVQLDVPRDETSCRGCGWRLVDCQDGEPGEVDLRCCETCDHPDGTEQTAPAAGVSFAEAMGWRLPPGVSL